MDNGFDITTKKPGDTAWGVFKPAITDPPDIVQLGVSTPVKGRLLRENEKDGIEFFTPLEPMHRGPLCYGVYALEHWLLADDEEAAWALRKELIFSEMERHKNEIVRLDGLLASQQDDAPGQPGVSRFHCRAISGNWCMEQQRPCTGWRNCGIKDKHGSPCPACDKSAAAGAPECTMCRHKGQGQEGHGAGGAGKDKEDDNA